MPSKRKSSTTDFTSEEPIDSPTLRRSSRSKSKIVSYVTTEAASTQEDRRKSLNDQQDGPAQQPNSKSSSSRTGTKKTKVARSQPQKGAEGATKKLRGAVYTTRADKLDYLKRKLAAESSRTTSTYSLAPGTVLSPFGVSYFPTPAAEKYANQVGYTPFYH
ncbi:hypothetical protein JCM5353_001592 [Sporobolomyces roseus]